MEEKEFQKRIQKIEGLVRRIETLSDETARASALELFQAIMDLHGKCLERMMEIAFEEGDGGRAIIDNFSRDELVSSLLLLYGLHPLDLEARVLEALDKVRPYLRSHGGYVELLGIRDGAIRLRLEGNFSGCGSSPQTLKLAIEEAIYSAAPDISALEIEGAAETPSQSGLVQLKRATKELTANNRE